jgi:hypothetical protein
MLHWKNRIALVLVAAAVVASMAGFDLVANFTSGFYW